MAVRAAIKPDPGSPPRYDPKETHNTRNRTRSKDPKPPTGHIDGVPRVAEAVVLELDARLVAG